MPTDLSYCMKFTSSCGKINTLKLQKVNTEKTVRNVTLVFVKDGFLKIPLYVNATRETPVKCGII